MTAAEIGQFNYDFYSSICIMIGVFFFGPVIAYINKKMDTSGEVMSHLNFNLFSAFHQSYDRKFIRTNEGTKEIRQTSDQAFATYCSFAIEEA
jgi:hypothetical protein